MICTEKLPVPAIKGGAIQTYISGVLPHLSSHHEITVLGIEDPSLKNEEMSGGVRYVESRQRFELYKSGVVNFLENHENSFDIIHIFNRPRLVLPVRSASGNARIILSMHNDMFNPEKIPYEEAVRVVSEVERIVTVSNYVGNVIKSLYPQAAALPAGCSQIKNDLFRGRYGPFLAGKPQKHGKVPEQNKKKIRPGKQDCHLVCGKIIP